VAFEGGAANLVDNDTNGKYDIFIHDCQTGETTRISVKSDGTEAKGDSHNPSLSADGQLVAFDSYATNLVDGDTSVMSDVFVRDRQTSQTMRVSVKSGGAESNGYSYTPSISADGRYVAFASDATNLVDGDTNGKVDIFEHDRQTNQTTRVSVKSDGTQGNNHSYGPSICADGRYVAFYSVSDNLVDGDTNGVNDVFVHDYQGGQTACISVNIAGVQGNSHSGNPSICGNGRYATFSSNASNLINGDTNGTSDIFVHDKGP
jgi:Tol biopolymer transport system component